MPSSDAFRRFAANLAAGGDHGLLTYDLESFRELQPPERAQAEQLLLARVKKERDAKAIETLGEVGSPAAIPALEALSQDPHPVVRSAANRALAKLSPSDEATQRVADDVVLAGGGLDAAFSAYDLRQMQGPEAIEGLLVAVESPQDVARIHGYEGLVEKLGLPESLTKPLQTPLRTRFTRAKTPFPSIWKPAARTLRQHLERLAAGDAPAALGLVYQPGDPDLVKRVWAGYEPSSPAFDVDAVRAMSGHDRAWAESHLYFQLSMQDPRAVAAIVALGMADGPTALREARGFFSWKAELVAAIDQALGPPSPKP